MDLSKFLGIREYHDGSNVVEYVNMIPNGNTCYDRLGELQQVPGDTIFYRFNMSSQVTASFVTHNGLTFMISDTQIVYTKDMTSLTFPTNLEYSALSPKPSYWCLTSLPDYRAIILADNILQSFIIPQEPFDFTPVEVDVPIPFPTSLKSCQALDITWYNNRLVLADSANNCIWISCVDPFALMENDNFDADHIWGARYYMLTTIPGTIQNIISFAGKLYIFRNSCINVYIDTNIDANPLADVPIQTLNVGGSSPIIIDNNLYFIGQTQASGQFAGVILQSGQYLRISNAEVEKRMNGTMQIIKPLKQRNQSFAIYYGLRYDYKLNEVGYAVGQTGNDFFWWTYSNEGLEYGVRYSHGDIGIIQQSNNNKATLSARLTNEHRYSYTPITYQLVPIPRYIRDFFMHFPVRQIIRSLELVCDTNRNESAPMSELYVYSNSELTAEHSIFVRLSYDRGLTFNRTWLRTLGQTNDKVIIWRNLGSCNSLAIEIGTSTNAKLQIYGLRLELA